MRPVTIAALALIFALGGCASMGQTETVTMSATRAAFAARAAHSVTCQAVESSHLAGLLTGQSFNAAKRACIDADTVLDAADAAVAAGRYAEAQSKINEAMTKVEVAKALSPAQ